MKPTGFRDFAITNWYLVIIRSDFIHGMGLVQRSAQALSDFN